MAEEYRGIITSAVHWDRALTQEEIEQICQNSPSIEEMQLVEDREFDMDFTFDDDPVYIMKAILGACGIDVDFSPEGPSELPRGEIDYSEVDGHTIDEMREIIGKWKNR